VNKLRKKRAKKIGRAQNIMPQIWMEMTGTKTVKTKIKLKQ